MSFFAKMLTHRVTTEEVGEGLGVAGTSLVAVATGSPIGATLVMGGAAILNAGTREQNNALLRGTIAAGCLTTALGPVVGAAYGLGLVAARRALKAADMAP